MTYGEPADLHHVMIDCGSVEVAAFARERVLSVPRVELFVLTHIDADHISGAVPLFTDDDVCDRFDDVWFNGWDQLRGFLSVKQGEAFSDLLGRADRRFRWNRTERGDGAIPPIVTDGVAHPEVVLEGGLRLTVLSPTPSGLQRLAANWRAALTELNPQKAMLGRRARPSPPADPSTLDLAKLDADGPTKDSSIPNLSSIAVLAEFGGRAVLLTGDAHADVLASSIRSLQEQRGRAGERLRLDALKLVPPRQRERHDERPARHDRVLELSGADRRLDLLSPRPGGDRPGDPAGRSAPDDPLQLPHRPQRVLGGRGPAGPVRVRDGVSGRQRRAAALPLSRCGAVLSRCG